MNTQSVASILCGLAGGAGLAAALLAGRSSAPSAPAPDPRLETVAKLEAEVESLQKRVGALENARTAPSTDFTRPEGSLAAAEKPAGTLAPDAAAPTARPEETLLKTLEALAASGFDREAVARFFEQVKKDKSHDAAIAAAKALLETMPRDAKAHYLLAQAYVQKLMTSSSWADMETYGNGAMEQYGAALAIDPNYWEPRFDRAVSYSFYPEQLGKLPESVRDFETLVQQQNRSTADPRYADTYVNLARVYVRSGKRDKAIATAREAAELFPENAGVRQVLADLEGE